MAPSKTGLEATNRASRWQARAPSIQWTALVLAFVASRLFYFRMGVRFDAAPLDFYIQYVDPALLKSSLLESIFYLKEQPPAFNLFLGIVLKLVPGDPTPVFNLIYLLLGLVLSLSLLSLLKRMGVPQVLSFCIAALCTISPVTVLFENWLFYAYPVAVLFCLSAVWLHRYVTGGQWLDGICFFSCLTLIGAIRGTYHLLWFVLIAGGLIWLLREQRRRIVIAMSLPAVLMLAMYGKNILLFGNLAFGEVLQQTNFISMATDSLDSRVLTELIREHKISRVFQVADSDLDPKQLTDLIPARPRTGIAVLDEFRRASGQWNWNNLSFADIVRLAYKDAQYIFRHYPTIWARHILGNFARYFRAADDTYPFNGQSRNALLLHPMLEFYDRITVGQYGRNGVPWIYLLVLPACVAFGLYQVNPRSLLRFNVKDTAQRARRITLLFMLFNIAYGAGLTILFSSGDHSRYRAEVSSFYTILFALLAAAVWGRVRSRVLSFGRRVE